MSLPSVAIHEMEQRDVRCAGAEPGSSGRVNKPEDKKYPEAGTLAHSSAEADTLTHSILGDLDILPDSPSFEFPAPVSWPVIEGERKQSDSESEGGIFVPRLVEPPIPRRLEHGGRSRKNHFLL